MVILKITTVYSGGATCLGYKFDKNVIKNVKLRTPKTSITIAQLMLPFMRSKKFVGNKQTSYFFSGRFHKRCKKLLNYYTYKLSLIKLSLSFPSETTKCIEIKYSVYILNNTQFFRDYFVFRPTVPKLVDRLYLDFHL